MKKVKKINCKENLDRKQELQSRRIKDKLLDENCNKEYFERLKQMYNDLCIKCNKKANIEEYIEYLNQNDIILYSACVRAKIDLSMFII